MMKHLNDYDSIKAIRIIPGPEVTGDDFFGRSKELIYLSEILKNSSSSIIIPGPRRWGKSSFVKELIRREEELEFIYLHLHRTQSIKNLYTYFLEIVRSPKSFVLKSKQKLKETVNTAAELFKKVSIVETGKIEDKENIELLNNLGKVIRHFSGKRIILVMDEISDFLLDIWKSTNKEEAVNFLKWLRTLRQENSVQMILTGSINVTSTIKKLGSEDLIGDLMLLQLKPMAEDESILFFRSLLKSKEIRVMGDALNYCVPKINDGIHYFIQVYADEISKNCDKGEIIKKSGKIKQIYNDLLESQLPAFSNFHTRLNKYFSKNECSCARKILSHLTSSKKDFDHLFALIGELFSDNKQKLYDLLRRLCDEGYLMEKGKEFFFISTFLKDYWTKHFYFDK
jgi:hypothetical protein